MASTLTPPPPGPPPSPGTPLRPDLDRAHVEGDVLRALVDGLIAEDLFGFRSRARIGSVAGALYLPLIGDERHVQIALAGDVGSAGVTVVFRARPATALQPYRLSRPPVLLLGPDGAGPLPLTARDLLDLLAARLAPARPANLDEVLDDLEVAVTHGTVLLETPAGRERVRTAPRPALLDWEALAAVGDRPFHPTARARHGWDRARHRRYSPAGDRPFPLDWVAVRRDHLSVGNPARLAEALAPARQPGAAAVTGAAPDGDVLERSPADALLSSEERAALEAAMADAGVDAAAHVVLPVHPWQRAHVLPEVFASEWRAGVCVAVAEGLGAFRPTASTRTLVPAGGSPGTAAVHVKLPLRISTLGAMRLLPPRYLANGARAQRLLEQAAAHHPALAGRLGVCDEQAWWAFAPPGGDPYEDKPGHLGCLLRVWPDAAPEASLVPLGALGVSLADGSAPGLARLVADRGGDPASPEEALAVFDDVAGVVTEVGLACFGLGLMPELHGQNAVVVFRAGRAAGVVLRDHDTVRLHRPWLATAALGDPSYDVKPGTPNTLWAADPEELLGWFQTLALQIALGGIGRALVDAYGIAEDKVWRRLADVVRASRAGVDLPPAAAEVVERQLFRAAHWPTKLVLGPLLARSGTGGGSMPSGTGQGGNPFLVGDDRAAELAAHAAGERLVNCYLRESGVEPVMVGSTATIPFPRTRRALIGSRLHRSATGHGRFRPGFTRRSGEALGPADLAALVAAELGAGAEDAERFAALVGDSVAKTRLFLEQLPVTGTDDPWHDPNPFLAAEQSLRFGHPLHPAAKASAGLGADELARYAPELGAAFPLHWLAVDPAWLEEARLATVRSLDPPPALCDAASARLGPGRATWPLLPCHPWQAGHLGRLPALAELVAAGRVVALGPLGPEVHPTASVRTVWDPSSGRQLKLPLSVRITNFVRENTAEQLRRSLDASRAVAALGDVSAAVAEATGRFAVLLEIGSRRLAAPAGHPPLGAELDAATGVIYRESPPTAGSASPMMVAALLEPDPVDGVPPVVRAVQQTSPPDGSARRWLERYLEVSLRPLTRLLVRHGVGLEAHTQNSLVVLHDGEPVAFAVRDLEGASLNRDHAAAGDGFGGAVAADSPALYGAGEVWRRFAYYVLVNHLGQLVATLAEHLGPSEDQLWAVVGGVLADEAVRHGADPAAVPLRHLLDGPALPAKANLVSVLGEHGEDPTWVAIPNPLRSPCR